MSSPPTLAVVLETLRERVQSAPRQADWADARTQHESLHPYAAVGDLLAVLENRQQPYALKDAVTRTLVQRQRQTRDPLWTELLLVAYGPLLLRLRRRAQSWQHAPTELDHRVVSAFLEALEGLALDRLEGRVCVTLRWATGRRFFRGLTSWLREAQRCTSLPPDVLAHLVDHAAERVDWPEIHAVPRGASIEFAPGDRRDAQGWLETWAASVVDAETMDMLVATLVEGESIRAYVQRCDPASNPEEAQRRYEKYKRRHSRALVRLRQAWPHRTGNRSSRRRAP